MGHTTSRRGAGLTLLAPVALALLMVGCSREAADWKQATLANTPEAYQLFLQQHPRGAEAVQARSRLQQLSAQRDWQIASSADTLPSYQQFLDQHPDSPWAQEARIRIENFARTAAARAPGAAAAGGNATPGSANPPAVNTPTVTSPSAQAPSEQASVAQAPAVQAPAAPTSEAGSSAAAPPAASASAAHHSSAHRAGSAVSHEHLARAARGGASRTVQLGAFSSRARAEHQWHLLSARYASLRTLHPRYVRVSGRSGTLYRLQVRLASPAAAQGLCATLHRHAQACVRVNA